MKSIYAARRKKFLNQCLENNINSYIVFGHGSALGAATQTHGQLRFLTGWNSFEGHSLFISTPKGEYLILSSPFLLPMARQQCLIINIPIAHIIYIKPEEMAEYLQKCLNIKPQKIGIVGLPEMPYSLSSLIFTHFPHTEWVSLDLDLQKNRFIKDTIQINKHRHAANICDHLFKMLPTILNKAIKTHQSVAECQIRLESQAKSLGAEFCKTWLTIQPNADYPRYYPIENKHVPAKNDQVLFGVMLMLDGHWGHGIRTGGLGSWQSQSEAQKELFLTIELLYNKVLNNFTTSNKIKSIENKINYFIKNKYTSNILKHATRFRNAHGLGYSYEEPILTLPFPQHFENLFLQTSSNAANTIDFNELNFQNGMLFELHPNLFLPHIGGVAIGNMLLISNNAPEVLLKYPTDWINWLDA